MSTHFDTLLRHLESNKLTKKDLVTLRRMALGWKQIQTAGSGSIVISGDVTRSTLVLGDYNIFIQDAAGEQFLKLWQSEQERIAVDPQESALQDYLSALRIDCDNHPYVSLYDIPQTQPLDQVYIPIQFRVQEQQPTPEKRDLLLSDILTLESSNNLVIVGGPGTGKSTILRQIAKYAWHDPERLGLETACLPMLLPVHLLAQSRGSLEERFRQVLEGTDIQLTRRLPDGFFIDWAKQENVKWLLLLDGLDEIPADRRASFVIQLRNLLLGHHEHIRIILTSRPSGFDAVGFETPGYAEYEVLPFSIDQTREFARRWLGEQSKDFLHAMEKVRLPSLYDTPLLLTIAIKIYLEHLKINGVGRLPDQRAELYGQFVKVMFTEADSRGLSKELGSDFPGEVQFLLSALAWEMTFKPELSSENELAEKAANYLREKNGVQQDHAGTFGLRFVQVMGRRSGIFLQSHGTYGWLHPTFREYLAAKHLIQVEQLASLQSEIPWDYHYLFSPDLEEVTLFIISILGTDGGDTTPWIRAVHDTRGSISGGEALREHGTADPAEAEKIIDELYKKAFRCWHGDGTVQLLGDLSDLQYARERLVMLVREQPDNFIDAPVRGEAVKLLGKHGHVTELIALAGDGQLDEWMRQKSAEVLEECGFAEQATEAWRLLSRSEDLDFNIRVNAAESLGRLGYLNEARERLTLQVLEENPRSYLPFATFEKPIKALGQLKQTDILAELVINSQYGTSIRLYAAQELAGIKPMKEIVPTLRSLAFDPHLSVEQRQQSAELLGNLGFVDEVLPILMNFLQHGNLYDGGYHWSIPDTLEKWGRFEELRQAYKVIVRRTELDENARLYALSAMQRKAPADDFLELVYDSKLDMEYRASAAFGYVERAESLAAVTVVINDGQIPAEVRLEAIQALTLRDEDRVPALELYVDTLLRLAEDPNCEESVRSLAIAMLPRSEDDIQFLIEFGDDGTEDTGKRVVAARLLFKLGKTEDALRILLLLASDTTVESQIRLEALKFLAQAGDSTCLEGIQQLAADEENKEVHDMAGQSALQILEKIKK